MQQLAKPAFDCAAVAKSELAMHQADHATAEAFQPLRHL
jgi:hypothetical protein